jgi:putative PIN family toxin of toxin-antitoxin system
VIDTSVLVAALRSSTGASHEVLLAADRCEFEVALSVPLLAEYDDVCHRPGSGILIPASAINDVINRIAQFARQQTIHYLWRGILPDPKDDMVLEVAVAAGATHLVTFNPHFSYHFVTRRSEDLLLRGAGRIFRRAVWGHTAQGQFGPERSRGRSSQVAVERV